LNFRRFGRRNRFVCSIDFWQLRKSHKLRAKRRICVTCSQWQQSCAAKNTAKDYKLYGVRQAINAETLKADYCGFFCSGV
jgi:hypothetical protein